MVEAVRAIDWGVCLTSTARVQTALDAGPVDLGVRTRTPSMTRPRTPRRSSKEPAGRLASICGASGSERTRVPTPSGLGRRGGAAGNPQPAVDVLPVPAHGAPGQAEGRPALCLAAPTASATAGPVRAGRAAKPAA